MAKKFKVIKAKKPGQSDIKYHPGGLHESTGTPAGEKIPVGKKDAALHGEYGPKAQKQAQMAKNIFHH